MTNNRPHGFAYGVVSNGEVRITHHGRLATILRGEAAADFLDTVSDLPSDGDDAQDLMARLTGNYKRGNERLARNHPRNRT